MNVLYSITAHECPECLRQLIQGIRLHHPSAIIAVHLNPSANINDYNFNSERVFINPQRFEFHWGWDSIPLHMSNYRLAHQYFVIDKICFVASNMVMIRSPEKIMKEYEVGFSTYFHGNERITPPIQEDGRGWFGADLYQSQAMQSYIHDYNISTLYGCVIDGGFISSRIMEVLDQIHSRYFAGSLWHCLEERLIPTVAFNNTNSYTYGLCWWGNTSTEAEYRHILTHQDRYFIKGVVRDLSLPIRQFYETIINGQG